MPPTLRTANNKNKTAKDNAKIIIMKYDFFLVFLSAFISFQKMNLQAQTTAVDKEATIKIMELDIMPKPILYKKDTKEINAIKRAIFLGVAKFLIFFSLLFFFFSFFSLAIFLHCIISL